MRVFITPRRIPMILLAVHMLGPKYTEGAYHEVEASSLRTFWLWGWGMELGVEDGGGVVNHFQ